MDRDDITSNEGTHFGKDGLRNNRGRFIVGDDKFIASSDDSLEALGKAIVLNHDQENDGQETTTPGDLRFGGTLKPGGSRGAKKGFYPKKSRGRPLIGAERRVKLNTSIAHCTQKMLGQHEVSLAKVLTDSAQLIKGTPPQASGYDEPLIGEYAASGGNRTQDEIDGS